MVMKLPIVIVRGRKAAGAQEQKSQIIKKTTFATHHFQ
jgi:phenylpyruvate tautomerase PptA (4-oxalocrotonate tautomerase family)